MLKFLWNENEIKIKMNLDFWILIIDWNQILHGIKMKEIWNIGYIIS